MPSPSTEDCPSWSLQPARTRLPQYKQAMQQAAHARSNHVTYTKAPRNSCWGICHPPSVRERVSRDRDEDAAQLGSPPAYTLLELTCCGPRWPAMPSPSDLGPLDRPSSSICTEQHYLRRFEYQLRLHRTRSPCNRSVTTCRATLLVLATSS